MLSRPLSACVYSSADSGAHRAVLRWEVSSSMGRKLPTPREPPRRASRTPGTNGVRGTFIPAESHLTRSYAPGRVTSASWTAGSCGRRTAPASVALCSAGGS